METDATQQQHAADGANCAPQLSGTLDDRKENKNVQGQTLIDPFMTPEIVPDRPYSPSEGTVAWCSDIDGAIMLEIFRRTDGSFGFQYQAWVAWRDAGAEIKKHVWCICKTSDVLIVDRIDTARGIAEQHAQSKGVKLDLVWRSVV